MPAGSCECFSVETIIDAGEAGQLEVGRAEFVALYESDRLVGKGALSGQQLDELMKKIAASRRVSRRTKQILAGPPD